MTPKWIAAATILYALIVMGASAHGALRLDRRIRRKGYQSPFRAFLMLLAYLSTIGLAFYLGLGSEGLYSAPSHALGSGRWRHIWPFIADYSIGVLVGMLTLTLSVLVLPRRKRRAGERRVSFPWQMLAYVCLLLVPTPFIAAAITTKVNWPSAFKFSIALVAGYIGGSDLAKRMRSPGLARVVAEDLRQPVLYLRAFEAEDEVFVLVTSDEARELDVPVYMLTSIYHEATLERYLAPAVQRHIGPFIALGDPDDYVPPAGAQRQYFADDSWFEAYKTLAQRARVIVMRPQQSSNLLLELTWLRDSAQLTKLIVLTAPSTRGWKNWRKRREKRSWTELAVRLASLGIRIGDYPGDGAVVTFNAAHEPVRLATGIRSPDDYVSAFSLATGTLVTSVNSVSDRTPPQAPSA
jgi:hypothetical protein